MEKRLCTEEIRKLQNHVGRHGTLSVWDMFGPYVSDRQWATVREDLSSNGDAWSSFPFEQAHMRAYRWGEDGIAGICDRYQVACISVAFWNGKDPILKERLFGVTPNQSNHGEGVREAYFYIDNTPTHSYMRYLYKYPQKRFPYEQLVTEGQKRRKDEPEYTLYDTNIFDEERYFDVFIEYAKENPRDIMVKITVINRGPDEAEIDIIPQVTFRNNWSWSNQPTTKPRLCRGGSSDKFCSIELDDKGSEAFPMLDIDYKLGQHFLYATAGAEQYFTENETNLEALKMGKNHSPYTKDAFHRKIIHGEDCTNPRQEGTKGCFHYKKCRISSGGKKEIFMRLTKVALADPLANISEVTALRKQECDEFYDTILTPKATQEERKIQQQAISGQLWSRQVYFFIGQKWFHGDDPNKPLSRNRNIHWKHLVSKHIIVMPDKWEYPWFAAWDLSFHSLTIALYDMALAKDQLWILLSDQFQHPNGQIPAYEWEFSDLNPPIQGWIVLKLYQMEKEKHGKGDRNFLQKCFEKLVINFVWWVNKVDSKGNNIFEGGFLGLDNIAVVDRSKPIPGGGTIEQSDATGWMGMFCLNLMRMAMELAKEDPGLEVMIGKFFQHFIYIANALTNSPGREIQNWNEKDGFFYDVMSFKNGSYAQIPVRSLVGIIPLFAIDHWKEEEFKMHESFYSEYTWYLENRTELLKYCLAVVEKNNEKHILLTLCGGERARRVLAYVWDPSEFRSEFGLRSLSKYYEKHPVTMDNGTIHYSPAESTINMFGGNSNWRGPIWMCMNYLVIESLMKAYELGGTHVRIRTKDGVEANILEMALYFCEASISIFREGKDGIRPYTKRYEQLSRPNWKEYHLFYEYFHGDTGVGLGASHQTGWTSLIANIIERYHQIKTELKP